MNEINLFTPETKAIVRFLNSNITAHLMHANGCKTVSRQSYRDRHKRRHIPPSLPSLDEREVSLVHEKIQPVKLRRRRVQDTRSFYDNTENDEDEYIVSKWTVVRQRLPDILALSPSYKPASFRAQLVLLIALMNKQANGSTNEFERSISTESNKYSRRIPNNITIDIAGQTQSIQLKRIPSEQMIHVDVDGLSFSIATRQFILAISRGYAQDTAAKYCPPAISDMLIDISKRKMIDDRRQFKRAQFKMRLGQLTFLTVFMFILSMVFALIVGAAKTVLKFHDCYQATNQTSNNSCILLENSSENQSRLSFFDPNIKMKI